MPVRGVHSDGDDRLGGRGNRARRGHEGGDWHAAMDRAAAGREAAKAKLSPMEQDLLGLDFEQPHDACPRPALIPDRLEKRHFARAGLAAATTSSCRSATIFPGRWPTWKRTSPASSGSPTRCWRACRPRLPSARVLSVSSQGRVGAGFATVPVDVEVLRYGARASADRHPAGLLLSQGPQDTKVRLCNCSSPAR